jgi:regulator of protease activity HflC (stomatin/prohibitin superfamily)
VTIRYASAERDIKFHPSHREVEKQLELQMQAERERRKQILDTQALINVSEGQKQRSILESEGGSRFRYLFCFKVDSDGYGKLCKANLTALRARNKRLYYIRKALVTLR